MISFCRFLPDRTVIIQRVSSRTLEQAERIMRAGEELFDWMQKQEWLGPVEDSLAEAVHGAFEKAEPNGKKNCRFPARHLARAPAPPRAHRCADRELDRRRHP
jgi:hypothetical protein